MSVVCEEQSWCTFNRGFYLVLNVDDEGSGGCDGLDFNEALQCESCVEQSWVVGVMAVVVVVYRPSKILWWSTAAGPMTTDCAQASEDSLLLTLSLSIS